MDETSRTPALLSSTQLIKGLVPLDTREEAREIHGNFLPPIADNRVKSLFGRFCRIGQLEGEIVSQLSHAPRLAVALIGSALAYGIGHAATAHQRIFF